MGKIGVFAGCFSPSTHISTGVDNEVLPVMATLLTLLPVSLADFPARSIGLWTTGAPNGLSILGDVAPRHPSLLLS
jgi:hypothetical protein